MFAYLVNIYNLPQPKLRSTIEIMPRKYPTYWDLEYFSLKNSVDTMNIRVSCPTDMSGKRIKAGINVPLTRRTNTFITVLERPVAEPNFNRDVVVGIARPLFLFTVK